MKQVYFIIAMLCGLALGGQGSPISNRIIK